MSHIVSRSRIVPQSLSLPVLGMLALALSALSSAARAEAYRVDPAQTRITFEIGAKGYPVTRGVFHAFTSNLSIDFDAPARSKVMFRVSAASLDTQSPALDSYVRGPVFLNAAQFPDITFASTAVEKLDDHTVRVTGNLTLLGVTKPESFLVEVTRAPARGKAGFSFSAEGRIHRSDFGMIGGLPLVSDEVGITVATLADAP